MRRQFYVPRMFLFVTIAMAILFGSLTRSSVKPLRLGTAVAATSHPRSPNLPHYTAALFVENSGQLDPRVLFQARGAGATISLTEDAIWFSAFVKGFQQHSSRDSHTGVAAVTSTDPRHGINLKLGFVGANPRPLLVPFDRLTTTVSYFAGTSAWYPSLPAWAGVRYKDLYPGIDLEISGADDRFTQRLVAHTGADPNAVRLRVEGADAASIEDNHLRLETQAGAFALPLLQLVSSDGASLATLPLAMQGHTIARPFASMPARADPQTLAGVADLAYAISLTGEESDTGITIDTLGNAYVTGLTGSPNFIATPGAYDTTLNYYDAFVVKLSPDSTLTFATFLGGSGGEAGLDIAIDALGAMYVVGSTTSVDFPTTPAAFDRSFANDQGCGHPHFRTACSDAFVTKLNALGTALVYSTFLGANGTDIGANIVLGADGTLYLAGSTQGGIPTTAGAFDQTPGGGFCIGAILQEACYDGFITHLSADGSALLYSTLLGGTNHDWLYDIALGAHGTVYVTGETYAPDFPVTSGALDTTLSGTLCDNAACADSFVAKLNANGTALDYATFLGGQGPDQGGGITVDMSGDAYITGETQSPDFPTTPGAFDRSYGDAANCDIYVECGDAFVAKLKNDGSVLAYSTFLGGQSNDGGVSIAVDADGSAFVVGQTRSFDFPATPGAYQTFKIANDLPDTFVTRLNATGSELAYASFLGGRGEEQSNSIAIDSADFAYITGYIPSMYVGEEPEPPFAFGDSFIVKLAVPPFVFRASMLIPPAGGSLATMLDTTSYQFPAGVFTDTVMLTHTARLERVLPSYGELSAIGHFFENTATYSSQGWPVSLTKPYSITVRYADSDKSPTIEEPLALYSWNGSQWIKEPSSTLDAARNTITATPNHFSLWAVLGETQRMYIPLAARP